MEKETVDFETLDVGERFCIPSHLDHGMEWFIKLPFNKARSEEDGRVEHFPDLASCFMFE